MAKYKTKKTAAIKISACYIVKDAARDLRRSLESVAPFVDEIVVVDTGSSDETVAVAQQFGAKIFREPWQDDFSAPKNVALREATGNWIVFLDADEFFADDTAQNLRDTIKIISSENIQGAYVRVVHVDADNDNKVIYASHALKIFAKVPGIRYVGKICESVCVGKDDLKSFAVIVPEKLTLWHTGYSKSIARSKFERDLKILHAELTTTDKPEKFYGRLAECYYGLENFADAEKYARLHVDTVKKFNARSMNILLDVLSKDPSRHDEYVEICRQATERYPHMPEFSARLAEIFAEQEDYRAAFDEMRRALDKAANYGKQIDATTFDADAEEHAQRSIDKWLKKFSFTPEEKKEELDKLTAELTKAYELFHDKKKSVHIAKRILILRPDEADPLEKVASIFIDYKMIKPAAVVIKLIEKKFPQSSRQLMLRANFFSVVQNMPEAIKYAERGLEINDGKYMVTMLLHNTLGMAYRHIGNSQKAIEHYKCNVDFDLDAEKDTSQFNQAEKVRLGECSNMLLTMHNINYTREELFEAACGFGKFLAHIPRYGHNRKRHAAHKKIRVGYISPDIRFHVAAFFSMHFFKSYDQTRFEIFIYANNDEDYITEQFKSTVTGFRNISNRKAATVAALIVADEIDILVELAGHTANNLLEVMAYKPAPIQISGIGYFDTTGLDTIDYFLADKFTDPEGLNEKFFTEKILRLQHSHFCYVWHDLAHPITPAPCTKNGYVTFVSFNNFGKMTDEVLRLWAKILDAVPNSRLLLKTKVFTQKNEEYALERMKAAGLDLDRVDRGPFEKEYLHHYERADIALDTFPYPGGGTTCDALYMGVPVITLVGERHNSRFGYSLLMNMGLEELCAFSEDEYFQKAVELAGDWDRIREYHLTIRRRMEESPVMNDTLYMGEVEQAYEKIFNAWLNNQPLPDFPQEPAPVTEELAAEYRRRAREYVALADKNGKSTMNRVDFKRTLYYAELAAQCPTQRDAELLLMIADRRYNLNDNIGSYEAIREAVDYIYSPQGAEKNYSASFIAECHSKLASYAQNNGHHVEAVQSYERAFELTEEPVRKLEFYDSILLGLHFLDLSSEELAAPHFDYQKFFEGVEQFTTYHAPHERIKVAYLSGDFRKHATFDVVFGFMSCHDRSKFEITCYSRNKEDDEFTELFRRGVEHFVDVRGLSDEELAKKIHDDEIDIAVDLAGHTGYNALPALAHRPAPVQICGLGYMSTTGLDAIDYFITDKVLDPPGEHEKFFTEKFLYMPAQFSYARREDLPPSEGAPCVKNGYVTFGTICRYMKINDDMLAVWTEILRRVPTAKLLMRAQEFISNRTVDALYDALKALGCDMDRVTIRPAVKDYFGTISQVDIILDAYPYVGGATTLDALYMGVPVVNLYGERHSTRFGKSVLASVGLGELATDSIEAYINTAVALANDTETLDVLHKNLRNMFLRSDALDPMKYCRLLEKKFAELLSARRL